MIEWAKEGGWAFGEVNVQWRLFLKGFSMLTPNPIHVKMGDPAYGGHAIRKRTLNFIIQWLRRSPIGIVNGRTLVRY